MKNLLYAKAINKRVVDPNWAKHLLVTHPIQFITTIGCVHGKYTTNIAPFATCLDTSYEPPYVTFSAFVHQHTPAGHKPIKGKMNTYLNIRQNGLFIVNTPGRDLLNKLDIVAYPYQRSHTEDKIEKAKLTKVNPFVLPHRHAVYPPLIQECLAHLECEVIDIHLPRGSDHYLITGRVVEASYDLKLGRNRERVREGIVRRSFHHFGQCGKDRRYIATLTPLKIKTLTLQLEHGHS